MLRYLLLIVFIISFRLCSYAQNKVKDTVYLNPRYKLIAVKDDSTHYFFTQYIRLKNKGVPDSINHWYFKLNNKK